MPVAYLNSGGLRSSKAKLAAIQSLHNDKVPIDLAWVGGGWNKLRRNVDARSGPLSQWIETARRGPEEIRLRLRPVHRAGNGRPPLRSSRWASRSFSTTTSNAPALLNLGNPAARKGITDLVSSLITATGITWYHQDFNQQPESAWAAADAPDRIGITEIAYITGLYAFRDELPHAIPD